MYFRSLLIALVFALPAGATTVREMGQLVLDGIPELPEALSERLRQYENVRAASFLDWQPKTGAIALLTRFGDTNQLHLVQAPGGRRTQLTFADEPVKGARFSPTNDRQVLLMKDVGGGEFYQFFRLDLDTGLTTLISDGKSRNESPLFSRNGNEFAFASTRRNGVDFDLWIQPFEGAEPRLVREMQGYWLPLDWSPNDGKILALNYVSINESSLHLVDVKTGEMTRVSPAGEKSSWSNAAFLSESSIVATTDADGEFHSLVKLDLETGRRTALAPGLKWDVEQLVVSRDLRQLAYVANENGASALYLADARKPEKARKVKLEMGVVGRMAFDPEGRRLGLGFNAGRAPGDVFTVDVKTTKMTRWTYSEVGGLNPDSFVSPELFTYPSFDGREIPAWIHRPRSGKGKFPVIISIHGGPEAQTKAWFSSSTQAWVNELGAVVIAPNVRGSSGYGKTWLTLDNGEKREDSVRDIGALLDWIATQPELDASRVAVIGGSYGGYMVLASLEKYSDRIRAGVDVVGISHFVTFLERTEGYRRDLRRAEYGDERVPEMRAFLERISPLTNAARIRSPLFVAHGANDPRVPAAEAEQIVTTVRKGGTEVWYLLARDEGHGFQKKRNRDVYSQVTMLFFQTFLLPGR